MKKNIVWGSSISGTVLSIDNGIADIQGRQGKVFAYIDSIAHEGIKVKKGDTVEYEFTGDHADNVRILRRIK